MAKYQRGMTVAAKASARSVKAYTRTMGESGKVTATSVAALTRSMSVSAKTTATSVAPLTRGMKVSAKITARSVKVYTRRIVETKEIERPVTKKGARGINEAEIEDRDPWGAYRFALFLGDNADVKGQQQVAYFMECSGLKNSAEVFEIQEGGLNGRTHKRPGQSKWENIVLKYGTSASNKLLSWRNDYLMDKFTDGDRIDPVKASGAIVLLANNGQVLRRYEFQNAWPVSWEGPSLSGESSGIAVETLELAHEGLTIVEGTGNEDEKLPRYFGG